MRFSKRSRVALTIIFILLAIFMVIDITLLILKSHGILVGIPQNHTGFTLPSGWKLYKNDAYHFSIAYPPGYSVSPYVTTKAERDDCIKQEQDGPKSTAGGESICEVMEDLVIESPSGDSYFDVTLDTPQNATMNNEENLRQVPGIPETISKEYFLLNGHSATKYIIKMPQNNHCTLYNSSIFISTNNLSYRLQPAGGLQCEDMFINDPTFEKNLSVIQYHKLIPI